MEQNIQTVHETFRQVGSDGVTVEASGTIRPHVSCHGCLEIAFRQLFADSANPDSAPSVGGAIAVHTLGEAAAFANSAVSDIFITGRVVTRAKIQRLMTMCDDNWMFLAVDNLKNVQDLSEAAQAADVTLGILVDVDSGYGYGGVAPGEDALALAQVVERESGLAFMGLTTYEGPYTPSEPGQLRGETSRRLRPVIETLHRLEQAGLEVPMTNAGSTYNYDAAARVAGITEVLAGVYPLMDVQTLQVRTELRPAAKVLATVISHPIPERAVVDAGHKTTGPDFGVAVLDDVPGAAATRFSAEHGILELEGPALEQLRPNDKVELIPYNLALCVNQFDYFRAVQNGKLVGYWPIAGRGRLD